MILLTAVQPGVVEFHIAELTTHYHELFCANGTAYEFADSFLIPQLTPRSLFSEAQDTSLGGKEISNSNIFLVSSHIYFPSHVLRCIA